MTFYQTENFVSSITVETLQQINADLDTEHAERMGTNQNRTKKTKSSIRKKKEQKQDKSVNVMPLPKIDPENTEHMRFYKNYINFYVKIGKVFSAIVSYDWIPKRHLMVWFVTFLVFSGNCLIIYTVAHHYYYGDYLRILEPLAVSGITISVSQKWFSHLLHFPKIFSLLFFPRKLCLENVTGPRADVLRNGLRKTCTVLKLYAVGVLALFLCLLAGEAKFFFVDNMFIPIVPFVMPFDESTISGKTISLLIQLIMGFYCFMGTIMYGSGFLICICNYPFLVDLIGEDFKDLDEMWNGSNQTSVSFRHAFLRNICVKLQDMNKYLHTTKDIYEMKLFIYFIVNFLGQIICLFEIEVNDYIPGYIVVLVLFTEMMFYCVVGTQLSIAGDRLCYIVSSTNWYTYDLASKRMLVIILHDCQRPKELTLGHLGPLNVVTLIQVVKGIYSYYTVMLEVL